MRLSFLLHRDGCNVRSAVRQTFPRVDVDPELTKCGESALMYLARKPGEKSRSPPPPCWCHSCRCPVVGRDAVDGHRRTRQEVYMQIGCTRRWTILASVLVAGLGLSPGVFADDHIRAVITERADDGTLTVQKDDSTMMKVVMTDMTKIRRTDGARVK